MIYLVQITTIKLLTTFLQKYKIMMNKEKVTPRKSAIINRNSKVKFIYSQKATKYVNFNYNRPEEF